MKNYVRILGGSLLLLASLRLDAQPTTETGSEAVEQIPTGVKGDHGDPPIRLEADEALTTTKSFQPPIEITIVAKTDSTNLRISYTGRVVFNWEGDKSQLRFEGGPGDGKHAENEGLIPADKYVTVRWVVTSTHEAIYVDDDLRFENTADYSKIDAPISIFGYKSVIKVMSLKVKRL